MRELTFRDLKLGKTSAEKESIESPELLVEGFFDPENFIATARKRGPFLFLGYKGSGKSAIGEHLRLTAEDNPNLFVRYLSLGDFPYTTFGKIIKGDYEPEAKYPDAWSWLLLLQIIEQFAKDQGSSLHTDPVARDAHRQMELAGLLPTTSLKFVVQQTIKRSGGVNWKAISLGREDSKVLGSVSDVPFFVEKLKLIVAGLRSESQHLIVIDGLDELLGKRSIQLQSLASLVYEIDRLNSHFIKSGCPVKLVLLCRTDIYELLPNANKNKIRQDSAVELVWFNDPKTPAELNMVRLANHRASLSAGRNIDIFAEFFPSKVGNHERSQDTRNFLLEFTRHTPRDFITLLNYIQKEVVNGAKVTEADIQRAVRNYSVGYFVPEIKDELNGYFTSDQINAIIALFSALGEREFTLTQLNKCISGFDEGTIPDLNRVLYHLFECSALGMLERTEGYTHFTVKYRNRNAVLDLSKKMILHRGMWKALNLR
jgi:hypothetical protein